MKSHDVISGNVPGWYDLSFPGNTLLLNSHPAASEWVCGRLTTSFPRAQSLQSLLDLPQFIGAGEETWGFGPVITKTSEGTSWPTWECPLPTIQSSDPEGGWDKAYAVSTTLGLLFDTLDFVEAETNHPKPQLLTINGLTVNKDSPQVAALGISLSPEMCHWLTGKASSELQEIDQAMSSAYKHMLKSSVSISEKRFQARFSEAGMLHLYGEGNSCSLDPSSSLFPGEGYELVTHNCYTPVQQLTLLVGIAKLYEIARREGV